MLKRSVVSLALSLACSLTAAACVDAPSDLPRVIDDSTDVAAPLPLIDGGRYELDLDAVGADRVVFSDGDLVVPLTDALAGVPADVHLSTIEVETLATVDGWRVSITNGNDLARPRCDLVVDHWEGRIYTDTNGNSWVVWFPVFRADCGIEA